METAPLSENARRLLRQAIETYEQLERLRMMGVRYAQGYLIGQAAPASAVLSGEAARGLEAKTPALA